MYLLYSYLNTLLTTHDIGRKNYFTPPQENLTRIFPSPDRTVYLARGKQ
jgi:hypothetical protein